MGWVGAATESGMSEEQQVSLQAKSLKCDE